MSTNQQFEQMLKTSDFLNSALQSQRIATAEAIAITVKYLVKEDVEQARIITAIIQDLTQPTGRPSLDGDRNRIAEALRGYVTR